MGDRRLTEDLLSALLDDELDLDTRSAVEARLAESAEWQRVLAEVAETRASLRGLGTVDAPAEFWDSVLAVDGAVIDLTARRARGRGRAAVALAGVAAAAAFVVGVVAFPSTAPDRVRPPVAAFSDAHAERSSVGADAISSLASVGVSRFGR